MKILPDHLDEYRPHTAFQAIGRKFGAESRRACTSQATVHALEAGANTEGQSSIADLDLAGNSHPTRTTCGRKIVNSNFHCATSTTSSGR